MAPFTSRVADYTGTGRFLDVYLQNLIPLPDGRAAPRRSGHGRRSRQAVQEPLEPAGRQPAAHHQVTRGRPVARPVRGHGTIGIWTYAS